MTLKNKDELKVFDLDTYIIKPIEKKGFFIFFIIIDNVFCFLLESTSDNNKRKEILCGDDNLNNFNHWF